MTTLPPALEGWAPEAHARLAALRLAPKVEELGHVERLGDSIAVISGLPGTRLDELLVFEGGAMGLAVDLREDSIGCFLLGGELTVQAGQQVLGTSTVVQVPVGRGLLGRVVDPLGRPRDGLGEVRADGHDRLQKPAPAIVDRDFVTRPLLTGLTVVDAMFPIGRGQRELIVGDRSTGKTSIAVDAMLQQRQGDVICVYVAIGQKASAVKRVIETVRVQGPFERTVFVVAGSDEAPGLQWLAPAAGFTLAEHFAERGHDALVILDDLTRHADVHRELALLLRQPAGREAYPGDVFHVHAQLLERAAQLAPERGGGSVTALPIAETQGGNLSGYIPTNLISITDGQLYLDARLFHEGQKPAVDVGRSVSRVGGKAQSPAIRKLAERLRLEYAQFQELEAFTHFGGMVDERTRKVIDHGRRIRALLAQPQHAPLGLGLQTALLLALEEGVLDRLPPDRIPRVRAELDAFLAEHAPGAAERVDRTGALDADTRTELAAALKHLPEVHPG